MKKKPGHPSEYLSYDKDTGIFIWLVNPRSGVPPGKRAGSSDGHGYRRIILNNRPILEHRLAWFFVHEEWPRGEIDHINGDKSDNRIVNLRDVSHRENGINKPNNRAGHLPGTDFVSKSNRWRARIKINGKQKDIGTFLTQEDAHAAYMKYSESLHKEGI